MVIEYTTAGEAFAMAEVYATRKIKVKLYRQDGKWFIETKEK